MAKFWYHFSSRDHHHRIWNLHVELLLKNSLFALCDIFVWKTTERINWGWKKKTVKCNNCSSSRKERHAEQKAYIAMCVVRKEEVGLLLRLGEGWDTCKSNRIVHTLSLDSVDLLMIPYITQNWTVINYCAPQFSSFLLFFGFLTSKIKIYNLLNSGYFVCLKCDIKFFI